MPPSESYPHLVFIEPTDTAWTPPDQMFTLGTVQFTPISTGSYTVELEPWMTNLYYGEMQFLECGFAQPVDVFVTPPLPPPGPPPGPAAGPALYHMGTVVNGDFEAGGSSLDGWTTSAWDNSAVTVETLENGYTDHAAKLHSEGEWGWREDPWAEGPGAEGWEYDSGSASISQTIYVPLDATELTFLYCARSGGDTQDRWPCGYVSLGTANEDEDFFADAVDWTTFVLPVNEADKGRRVELEISAYDGGWGWVEGWESEPETTSWLDLYLDYIGINGTAATIQTTTWAAGAGGGAWGLAGNWNPGEVPDNSLEKIHDVLIPESAGGPGVISVSAPRTIQTLNDNRTQGTLEVESGGSLNVFEDVNIAGATVRIQPGGQFNALSNMTVTEGALMIHPDGSPAGGEALTVEKTLKLGTYSWEGGTSADLSVCDATVAANMLNLRSQSTATLTKSPAFEGPTSLVVNTNIYVRDSSTLTIGSGTKVVTRCLNVSSSAVVNVEDGGTIGDLSPGSTVNYGTVEFVGDVLFDQDGFSNRGTLTVSGGEAHMTGNLTLYSGSDLAVTAATLRVDGILRAYDGCSLAADAASTIALGTEFVNGMGDGAAFFMDDARMLFDGGGVSWMDVAGLNRGPFSSGLVDNFAVGLLEVAGSTGLALDAAAEGGALYVHDLTVGTGSTLNLNGVPVYYSGQFVNNGSCTGGLPQPLYELPAGLPATSPGSYTATATAPSTTDTQTDQAAYAEGEDWGWWDCYMEPATAEAYADLVQQGDAAVLILDIEGSSGMGMWEDPEFPEQWEEEPIPASASASLEGTVQIGSNDDYPVGTSLDLLILPTMASLETGGALDWWCTVEHGTDSVTFGPGATEAVLWDVLTGDVLDISAYLTDDTGWDWDYWDIDFDHRLEVTFVTTPEPATLALVGLGLAGCLALRRRK